MDNIKFRAWIKENYYHSDYSYMLNAEEIKGVMLDGSVLLKGETLIDEKAGWFDSYGSSDVELMQYANFADKKGNRFCDGDVVKFTDKSVNYSDTFSNSYARVFKDTQGTYRVKGKHTSKLDAYSYRNSLEIVGNIYENSDLLEKDHWFTNGRGELK